MKPVIIKEVTTPDTKNKAENKNKLGPNTGLRAAAKMGMRVIKCTPPTAQVAPLKRAVTTAGTLQVKPKANL